MTTLKNLVLSSGKRQTWVATYMGVNHTLLNHWLQGRRPLPTQYVDVFAAALQISPEVVREIVESHAG